MFYLTFVLRCFFDDEIFNFDGKTVSAKQSKQNLWLLMCFVFETLSKLQIFLVFYIRTLATPTLLLPPFLSITPLPLLKMPAIFHASNSITSHNVTLAPEHLRRMVPLRKAAVPSSSSSTSLNARTVAGADFARAKATALIAKYHATWASRIPIPMRSSPHRVHVKGHSEVRDIPPKPLKSLGVEAARNQLWAAAKTARDYEAAQHQKFLNRHRCRFIPVRKNAPQLHKPTFEQNHTPPRPRAQNSPQSPWTTSPSQYISSPSPRHLLDA